MSVPSVADEPGSGSSVAVVASRPDVVSAMVSARSQGRRVEVEGLRTESSTTYANPDGTLTTNQHQGVIRFKDEAGEWQPVDLELADNADGTVAPASTPIDLSLAGEDEGAGGGAASASLTDVVHASEAEGSAGQARNVSLGWSGEVDDPVLEGSSATYEDVKPGVDLVVQAQRTGFEQHLVIESRAALKALTAADGSVRWQIPVGLRNLTARAESDGSVSFVDAGGKVASSLAAPVAWDAKTSSRSGDPENVSDVDMAVSTSGSGSTVVTLTPDRAWLESADRVFPVTIDPTYVSGTVKAAFDTYVSKSSLSTSFYSEDELKVGTYNGGSEAVRTFMNFPVASFRGRDIVSASLNLWETHSYSYSCSARAFYVKSAGLASGSSTWSNQPSTGLQHGSLSVAKGYSSSCAAGWVSVGITSLVDAWSGWGADVSQGGLRLHASESDSYGWKKFMSGNAATHDPYISFTYNRAPATPSAPVVTASQASSYTPPSGSPTEVFTLYSRPKVEVTGTDPDASRVKYTVQFHTSTAGTADTLLQSCTTSLVVSGQMGSCQPGSSFASRVVYARSRSTDERGLVSGWSGWGRFVTNLEAPAAPVISCPSPWTNGSWADDGPASDVTCTITAAGTAGSTNLPGYIDYRINGGDSTRVKITPSADPAVAKTTVVIKKTDAGAHAIRARAYGRGLKESDATDYAFGWGGASMTSPSTGTSTTSKVKVTAGSAPRGAASGVTAKVRWRFAGAGDETSGWTDGPAVSVTSADASTPVTASGVFDPSGLTVDAAGTSVPARTPVSLDVQVCFSYAGSGTQCTWSQSKVTITRLPHAFGDGFPTADAGDGQVALATGEVSLTGGDVSVPGYDGDLSVSRSALSFADDGTTGGWPDDPATAIFGPGWTASLDGPDSGSASMTVVDNTRLDGTLVLTDDEGGALVWASPAGTRAYTQGSGCR